MKQKRQEQLEFQLRDEWEGDIIIEEQGQKNYHFQGNPPNVKLS